MSNNKSFDIASLHKVRPEITNILKTLENNLGEFVDDNSVSYILSDSIETLQQTMSVLELINLSGSKQIITSIIDALKVLVKEENSDDRELIYSISEGVMTLKRYMDFVLLKEKVYPKLLLTAINKLKISLKQPLLGESAFDGLVSVEQSKIGFRPIVELEKHALLHKAFRYGLNEVIKNKNSSPNPDVLKGIQLMQVACQRITGQVDSKFWEIAHSAVSDIERALPLTPSRKRTLIFLEKQFLNSGQFVDEKGLSDLINMAASRDNQSATKIRQEFNIKTVNDTEFLSLHDFMFGPTDDVVDTVNELIQEEISSIKDMVDTEARKDSLDPENIKKIAVSLRDLSLRLLVLELKKAAESVIIQARAVSGWQTTANPEQFEQLLSALLYAENATILMAKNHTAGLVSLPLNNTGISLHQLDTAFELLVQESRNTLINVVNSINAYASSENKDLLHLANIPIMLTSVGGAMLFIDVSTAYKLLTHTAKFLDKKVKAHQHFDEESLDRIADIIMSADYYLESIEQKQPSGDTPLIIGAKSLKALMTA